jgi:hypothetical protein
MEPSIGYTMYPGHFVPSEVLKSCADNFSNYYGVWQDKAKGRVKMSAKMIATNNLSDPSSFAVVAFDLAQGIAVGHAFFTAFKSAPFERVVWITQLVVCSEYRGRKIAQTILHTALGTTCDCAGLVSSHPYAVLALEKAFNAKCSPIMIRAYASSILANSAISYLKDKPVIVEGSLCVVNTDFSVDHEEPLAALAALGAGWALGELPDGHEFLAIVFKA